MNRIYTWGSNFLDYLLTQFAKSRRTRSDMDGQNMDSALIDRFTSYKTVPSSTSTEAYIAAYFEWFHPSFPLLHQSTFGNEIPEVLKFIVTAIGCLYTARTLSDEGASSCVKLSKSLWDTGRRSLARLVGSDWKELRRTWTMQAWILHIIYGAFMGSASQYKEAKKMLRTGVDAAQDLGLFRQTVPTCASQPWIRPQGTTPHGIDGSTPHDLRMLYVEEESTKLSMYTLLFLDFHMSAPCNARLLTSSLDLDWELPFSIALWEADTAASWSDSLSQEPRVQALFGTDETAEPPCPNTRSLALATQSLMSGSPSPHWQLMVALAVSPMATLFVLTNIDAFVRDFTRCYYQMPPALSDPSAFHIFTQSQNRQVIAALRHIARVVPSQDLSESTGSHRYRPIWRAIECIGLAVKIALYKPDDLLIGGIVDSSVVAGLATATHLTLGRYAGTRRSLEALLQHNTGDDAVIMILDEAMALLSSVLSSNQQDALREPPWATMASYRIVLAIWRSLRWAASEMRARSADGAQGQIRRRFEAPTVIFHAIVDVAMEDTALPGQNAGQEGLDAMMAASSELGEACYAKAVMGFWRKRSVWPIGSSMATVLEEIVSDEYPDLVDNGVAAWWSGPASGLG
ncbi:hypothetical protein FJTKL_07543 [Diaporthe vaccinii]|uniref:Xylanolytic transcriptional activator regulatory domain-containing protein n=1 Tax=Diaporthe vaccinii TaxID=105482 RepID=A0ABR4ETR0_9PEZI